MRIVSKFKDYYDSVGALDSELKPLYIRKTQVIEKHYVPTQGLEENIWRRSYMYRPWPHKYNGDGPTQHDIAFCGKSYAIIEHAGNFYTSVKDLHRAVMAYKKDQLNADSWMLWAQKQNWRYLDFEYQIKPMKTEVFLRLGTPVFVNTNTQNPQTILNPCLADLGFQKLVHPYNAYQELDMFLSNQMAQQVDPVPCRTDDLIRDQHGFDKHSFRTSSPGKKRKRKKSI